MQFITIRPPLVKGDIGSADEGKRVVIDLAIQRRESLVYLSYPMTSYNVSDDSRIETNFSEQLTQPAR